jgi:BirA family biotin operon repressor/biotin-[acetyl-CoA-carboxylase] ligase
LNAVLPAGYRLQVYASVDSTNTRALAAARVGDAGGLWITAREQTVGRGRRARSWSSPPGNLYASLLLINPSRVGNAAGTISLVAAVALDQALIDLAGPASAPRLALKWPNDVLCDGRKIAGILVEGEELGRGRNAVVVGVGVNCRSHPEIEGAQPAGDLAALGFAVAPEVLFGRLAIRLDDWTKSCGFGTAGGISARSGSGGWPARRASARRCA